MPNPLETITTQFQAARFGSLCNLYVPRYRQATIGSYPDDGGTDLYDLESFQVAYADVLDAFQTYLATYNEGRPFVLLGHSQGTHHLIRLLQEEFDDAPALRGQLISALLVGPTGRLRVPPGRPSAAPSTTSRCARPPPRRAPRSASTPTPPTSRRPGWTTWTTGRCGPA